MSKSKPRYVIFGAGAIGCVTAGLLNRAGSRVICVARPAYAEALMRGITLKEESGETWARVFPHVNGAIPRNGDLIRNVLEAANAWEIEEIRTEEGRLDEVFRSITLPETMDKHG